MEHDYLGSSQLAKLSVSAKDGDAAASHSTSSRGLQLDDKAIRNVSRNAVAMSVLTLRQAEHQRIVDVICVVSEILSEFQGLQNRTLRSIDDSERWIVDMCEGGYTRHLATFVSVLMCEKLLLQAGFAMPISSSRISEIAGAGGIEHEVVAVVLGHPGVRFPWCF